MSKVKRWYTKSYEIQSVTQVVGVYAVHAHESESEKGKFEFDKCPVNFLGVARVKVITSEKFEAEEFGRVVEEESQSTSVVGMILQDGCFWICDEDANFIGLLMEGDSIESLASNVRHKYPSASKT